MTFYKDPYYKYFSTKEAAQNYIDSLKPKYKVGEWLYTKDNYGEAFEILFRYSTSKKHELTKDVVIHGTECYTVWNAAHGNKVEIDNEELNCCFDYECTKADADTVQRILSKVAQHKGFKEGVKFKNVYTGRICIVNSKLWYDNSLYKSYNTIWGLACTGGWIYGNNKWAEIVEETNTKSVTITVDGDVVNTSHWGNSVNIVYK